ncbi:heme-binding protein [Sorangium sp. So ce726]|uniref:heme-binding protein n=1 Tax=Sorangium sp. So ce726 TaxID=3133319 RepID=UPI003F5E6420
MKATHHSSPLSEQIDLGPLADLPGFWEGTGFSLIARPQFSGSDNGFFLQLNLLRETIEFTSIGSPVVNRGSRQGDIAIGGVTYLHRVTDATTGAALHIEPGTWLNVPPTQEPASSGSIARLATIPHGNSICLVGSSEIAELPPTIPPANTVPFKMGGEAPPAGTKNPFPEYDLSCQTRFRTDPLPAGITQDLIDDPNSALREALKDQEPIQITRLITMSTSGGVANIPFIVSNANTATVESVFAIERVRTRWGATVLQLQYSQTALLSFGGLTFPHVTVGTLIKAF